MRTTVEVFADISCPFTHVGLGLVRARFREVSTDVEIVVRAWPLEWVNGAALEATAVAAKVAALCEQLDIDLFAGFRLDRWPGTTMPALNLAAAAYDRDPSTGLSVSLALRNSLFEDGRDISNASVLAEVAFTFGLPDPPAEPTQRVVDDYWEGQRRKVTGSPHFWIDGEDYLCPSLDIGHDEAGALTAQVDSDGLARVLSRLSTGSTDERG